MITLHCRPAGSTATEVLIGPGVRSELAQRAAARGGGAPFALVDAHVEKSLPNAWRVHRVAGGEAIKTLAVAEQVLRAMVDCGVDRKGLLVAVGGGSVGDLGGLCAALFLRGIECWQVPTTLLAMVDSAVGGKTAVNLPEGKNLVGVVHAPRLVLIDLDFVATLPEHEFQSGLAESIKVGIGLDRALFELLENERERVLARDTAVLMEIVQRSLQAKIDVVEGDLHEGGRRRLLNLGHTLGHALEAHGGHNTPHGLCVARGLHFAVDVARELGELAPDDAERCRALLRDYGHERAALPPADALRPFMMRDKKVEGTAVHFVVPTGIGRSDVRSLPLDQLASSAGFR